MIETNTYRKNKISLSDYNYRKDIENRLLMTQFSPLDLEVLEEILHSSLQIPIQRFAKDVDQEVSALLPCLEKLSQTGLFTLQQDQIVVDKEMRKYYEAQLLKFDQESAPGMDFLQGLLKKVPIHILPTWYSIPRTSNNIFDSLIEKYLGTPQTFQRYLAELTFPHPVLTEMMQMVYQAQDFSVPSHVLMERFNLSRHEFEEHMLHLEFNFVCCLGYKKTENTWKEMVFPYKEWREYLLFLRDTTPPSIATLSSKSSGIERVRTQDFAFIKDLAVVLSAAKKQPIPLSMDKKGNYMPQQGALAQILSHFDNLKEESANSLQYVSDLIAKLQLIKLADIVDDHLYALESANDWLEMRLENRALYLYRHPLNRLKADHLPPSILTERNIREAEKSILRVLNSGWVYFDDFIKGALVALSDDSFIALKRCGRSWKYTLPQYTEEERSLIKATVLQWLFEMGVIAKGTHQDKECFCVTSFGQSLFGR